MTSVLVSGPDTGRSCPYCRFPLKEGGAAERCDACGALHHEDCWADNGGCAVLGCANGGKSPQTTVVGGRMLGAAAAAPDPAPASAWSGVQAAPPPEDTRRQATGSKRGLFIGIGIGLAVAAAGVAGYALSRKPNSPAPAAKTVPVRQATQPAPGPATTTSSTASSQPTHRIEGRAARQIESTIELSLAGRSAVRRGAYAEAIANRREILRRLDAIHGATGRLAGAKATLRQAMSASLESDTAYASGQDASVYDKRATALKRSFVRQFAPLARRHGLTVYADGDF